MTTLNPALLARINALRASVAYQQRFGQLYEVEQQQSQDLNNALISRSAGSSLYDPVSQLGFQLSAMLKRSPLILNFFSKHFPSVKFKAVSLSGDSGASIQALNQQRRGVDFVAG